MQYTTSEKTIRTKPFKSRIEAEFSIAAGWFDVIAEAVGSKKKPVIVDCKTNSPIAWSMLKDYLNPYHVFHIGTKSLESDVKPGGEPFKSAAELISHLTNIAAASNEDIARIKQTFSLFENETVSLFAKLYVTRGLKIGVTADTVNKAIGENEIPTFNCMLAKKYVENRQAIIGKQIAVTEKLDGIRALTMIEPFSIKENENIKWTCSVKIYSRQGKRIEGLVEVERDIKRAMEEAYANGKFTGDIVLDGELLITDRHSLPSKEQYKQTMKIVSSDIENKTGITYNIFDVISKQSFTRGSSASTYTQRRSRLNSLFPDVNKYTAICVVPVIIRFSFDNDAEAFDQLMKMVNRMRAVGKEGIMLNIMDAPYVCKRTSNLLKVKVFEDCDLRIVGFQEGTGKYVGTLGALIVDYKGTHVGVGTGLTDQAREFFWSNQETMLGRVVTIQYFEETHDSTGKTSIRFPVFKELRDEGKEVSYN